MTFIIGLTCAAFGTTGMLWLAANPRWRRP